MRYSILHGCGEVHEQQWPSANYGLGSGHPTREFLHADDCAEGILLAAERYDKPEPVNLGTGMEISIKDLVSLIMRVTGFEGDVEWDCTKPDGQPRRCLDTSRAEAEFGFRARIGLEEGIRQTVESYTSMPATPMATSK